MTKFFRVFIAAIILSLSFSTAIAAEYRLATGDVIGINVWGYEEFPEKNETEIRPDGKITVPLLGEVQAGGLSVKGLTTYLAKGLSEYLKDPKVTVNVLKFHTTRVYVLGEVQKPGLYELPKEHNLLDAVAIAGGYTKNAAKKKVMVIRKDQPGKYETANFLNLLNKADLSQNYALKNGDIVFLTDNGRIDFAKDIMPFLTAMYYIDDMKND